MRGGTYSEALKAGFNSEQAGFFARLGCDTKNEVYTHYAELEEKRKVFKAPKNVPLRDGTMLFLKLIAACGVGFIIGQVF